MDTRGIEDPVAYAETVLPFLLRAPARHNLFLGILDTLQRHPATYPVFHLWVVEDDGEVVGAALQTPPHNIAIAQPGAPGAVDALAAAIGEAGIRPPGVVGGLRRRTRSPMRGARVSVVQHRTMNRQGVYELTAIRDAGAAEGAARLATQQDLRSCSLGRRTSSWRRSRTTSATTTRCAGDSPPWLPTTASGCG